MASARDFAEHLERTIADTGREIEALVDRHDAAVALREMFYAADVGPDATFDEAVAAMTPTEVDRARLAVLSERMTPNPDKETP